MYFKELTVNRELPLFFRRWLKRPNCAKDFIPFPEVVVPAEDAEPQHFYVFRGYSEASTVIHIPLFNAVNCKGNSSTLKTYILVYNWFHCMTDDDDVYCTV